MIAMSEKGLEERARERWGENGYDIENAGEWEATGGGRYWIMDEIVAENGSAGFTTTLCSSDISQQEVQRAAVEIIYDDSGVKLTTDLDLAFGGNFNALVEMGPETARELATQLYMAAEELERRQAKS